MNLVPRWYERRLRLMETNLGKGSGWYVELKGRRLAVLSEYRMEEMFWDSYRLEPVTDDPMLNQRLLSDFWLDENWIEVVFRNREFTDIVVRCTFPSSIPFQEPGRLMIRGLYYDVWPAMPWDHFFLWWRRRRRNQVNAGAQ